MSRAALSLLHRRLTLVGLGLVAVATAVVPLVAGAANGGLVTLAVSPSGSDGNPCTRSAPCASFGRAYRVAKPGQVVEVGSGNYGSQQLKADATKKSGRDVVFRPGPAAQVTAGVTIYASHVELRDMKACWEVKSGARDVTIRNVKSPCAFFISGASNVSVLGGEVYSRLPVSSDSGIASVHGLVPTNILIDGVYFHDFIDVGPGQYHHIECLQVGAAINLTIRNSKFRNCATHDIFIRSWGHVNDSPYPLSKIVIENNWFAETNVGYYAVQAWDDLWTTKPKTSITIRNNSALQSILVRWSHGTAAVHGNIIPSMPAYFCSSYGQRRWFDYNLYASGVPCGRHDRIGDPRYVDTGAFDLHLRAGSAAIEQGDPKDHPRLDIEGKLRPKHSRPDAGASQWESANITLGRSIGNVSLGEAQANVARFYGSPTESSRYGSGDARHQPPAGTPSGTLVTYRLHHGESLWVLYDSNRTVVGLGTSSPYYSTPAGYGAGTLTQRLVRSWNLRWVTCEKAYSRNYSPTTIYVDSSRGVRAARAESVWMVRREYAGCGLRPR